MRVLIDADGCPVVDIAIEISQKFGAECHILCDTAHIFDKKGAVCHVFSKGADSVDFALVNFARRGDVVITQDYGLASMCLARGTVVIDQNGREYTQDNIGALLMQRHTARKVRNAGGRLKGPPKRQAENDEKFRQKLASVLDVSGA